MPDRLRLLCVLAHPDDESLATGGILAKYAAEGVATSLITATRGEHGWFGDPTRYPGPRRLGQIRAAELRKAARVLGLEDGLRLVIVLSFGYRATPREAEARPAEEWSARARRKPLDDVVRRI